MHTIFVLVAACGVPLMMPSSSTVMAARRGARGGSTRRVSHSAVIGGGQRGPERLRASASAALAVLAATPTAARAPWSVRVCLFYSLGVARLRRRRHVCAVSQLTLLPTLCPEVGRGCWNARPSQLELLTAHVRASMGDTSDREALRLLLRRVDKIHFEPNADERRVLSSCEQRVLLWVGASAVLTSSAAALALRRMPLPGPMSRLMATAVPGTLAAHTALGLAGESCLADIVAIAETSPLGGEAVRVLQEHNPASQVLKNAPSAARWAPDSLPRLPEPYSGDLIRERLAAAPPKAAPVKPEADAWTSGDVLKDVLGVSAPPQAPGSAAPPSAKQQRW